MDIFSIFTVSFLIALAINASGHGQVPYLLGTETKLYSYGGSPQAQFDQYPVSCKTGSRQSPIDINKPINSIANGKLVISKSWNIPRKQEILINTGHKPQLVDFPSEPKKFVQFNGNNYQYIDRHYHFGSSNEEGSTHALFGKKFSLEIHTCFVNTKYGLTESLNHPDGWLAMAQLFKIGKSRPDLEILLPNFQNIVYPNQTTIVNTGTKLIDIVPINSNFYYYHGSVESPSCDEGITWIIFEDIGTLGSDQLERFRNVLRTPSGDLLIKNWRFLQPRNGRGINYVIQSAEPSINFYLDEMIG